MSDEKKIWDRLLKEGFTECGVAGVMGNLYAESGMKSNNLQNSYEKKFGLTDDQYTTKVDNGSYTNFVHDSAGYGLAQWTYYSRKEALYNYQKGLGKSIGDLDGQLEFLCKELKGYTKVINVLKNATSVKEASDIMLHKFEAPADQSAAVENKRASYSQVYYDKYATKKGSNSMSNSSLVNCVVKSPNHSGARTHAIDTLTPHCVVGQLTAASIGGCFTSSSKKASCNYGIGSDLKIVLVVDECNRSWCTSSNANDQRAVTIECASDLKDPYAMTNGVYEKLIELCTDICRRNGKTKVVWLGSKEKELAYAPKSNEMLLTAHRWYANKSCPGDWLYSRYGDLANRINANLSGTTSNSSTPAASTSKPAASSSRTKFNKNDVVDFKGTVHYKSADAANGVSCKPGKATVTATAVGKAHPYHLVAVSGKGSTVYGWVNESDISGGSSTSTTSKFPYQVRVKISDLNIRTGPGTNYNKTGKYTGKGLFHIVAESTGPGASLWGKLQSGAGWIALDSNYCDRV